MMHRASPPVKRWREATRREPCPCCGHGSWCQLADTGLVVCRRAAPPGAKRKLDKLGVPFAIWHRDGLRGQGDFRPIPRPAPEPARAEPDLLHRVYSALLSRSGLLPAHRQQLRQRGLSKDAIDANGYATLPGQDRVRLVRRLLEDFGPALFSVPGFILSRRPGREPFPSLAGRGPALMVPVRDLQGRVVALKLRHDDVEPGQSRYCYLSSKRHGGPGPGCPAHVPLGTPCPAPRVRVSEGELKSDAAWELSETPTLSAPGVGNWPAVLPALEALEAREVLGSFDMDSLSNSQVAFHLLAMLRALHAAGARVGVELWGSAWKGVDDCLAAGIVPDQQWLTAEDLA